MKVTLAFKHSTKNWMSQIIAKLTKSNYDHVEIIIGTVWVGATPTKGVSTRRVEYPLHDTWDYLDVDINPKFNQTAVDFIDEIRGNAYDYVGAMSVGLDIPDFDVKNKYFCSELVTAIMQHFECPNVKGLKPADVDPQELYDYYVKTATKRLA